MAALYLDTSALAKLYLREAESAQILELASTSEQLTSSWLAYPETFAALAKARRTRRASAKQVAQHQAQFQALWDGMIQVEPAPALLKRAAQFADGFELRGSDAVHLASAEALSLALARAKEPIDVVFVSFDEQLNKAARLLGLEVTF